MKKKAKDELGLMGEQLAAEHLEKSGYRIIERNWKHHPYEIDMIAEHEGFTVIVEVKTRASSDFGDPQDFVSRKKQSFLVRAAQFYAEKNNVQNEIRFDVVAVILNSREKKIECIPGAFVPLLGM